MKMKSQHLPQDEQMPSTDEFVVAAKEEKIKITKLINELAPFVVISSAPFLIFFQ